jgi:hypothetical protein
VKIATDHFASLKTPAENLWESANEKYEKGKTKKMG